MCDLCDERLEVRADERRRLRSYGDRLRAAATDLGYLADGRLGWKPHTDQAAELGARLAKLGIDLIKEWG